MAGHIDLLTGLPLGEGRRPHERADAARNRAKVLTAAARLFAVRDPRGVTMEDIARAAGVGRGTLYRRYPDPASIAIALLDEHERGLQAELLGGPPPLGPGAPPGERLAAFYAAMVELLEQHVHLALGAEVGRSRFATGAYGFWHAHVRTLLRDAGVSGATALADTLLAPLAPEIYLHQREQGILPGQITAALARLAHGVIAVPDSSP
ncbi:TetR/AcrR family transcriptional regulator [Actinomadura scrupuli]|uniref:TetR/AcrR family transcriptional regulator n=1 Tax=Actinomadura scrupuli TaxID=559629 RepID=UPI003D951E1D